MNHSPWSAIGIMLVAMVLIPVGDAIAKLVLNTTTHSPQFVAWVRFLVGGVVMLPFLIKMQSYNWWQWHFIGKQLLRAVLIVLTVVTIIKAVGMSPIAEVFGAFFVGPVLSVILSSLLLRERATWLEWCSVVVGFVGVLFVVQPASLLQMVAALTPFDAASASYPVIDSVQSGGVYWALLAGVFYGAFLTATRWAAQSGPPLAQVIAQFLLAAALLSPFGLYELAKEGVQAPQWLLANGISSVLANLFSIIALSRAGAAVLAPVVYMQVVAATIIGLMFFHDSLSVLAGIGIAVIVVSGLLRVDLRLIGIRQSSS